VYTTPATVQHTGVRVTQRSPGWLISSVAICVCTDIGSAQTPPVPVPARDASAVPLHNRADLKEPPSRPPASDAADKAKRLFDAILADAPERAQDVFFPRAAFLLVKDIPDPGKYYDRLKRRFEQDVHALHASLADPASAQFERFELANRGGFVRVHEEGNRLPYWASRHSFIHFRMRGKPQRLEVRVLITWDDHWYVIHLNEFRAGVIPVEAVQVKAGAKVTNR
jgi:hypothetical protein